MALLPILQYPDPRLHKVSREVAQVDDRIRRLIDDMLDTMYDANGCGLAAPQVDVHERVVVIDTSDTRAHPIALVNPEIVGRSPEIGFGDEGCLSVPSVYDKVARHREITVRALDRQGQPFEMRADGLAAVCIQHELDHLVGRVFVEYLSPLKRDRIRTKMLKRSREALRT